MLGVPVLLVALLGISAFADQSLFTFPEDARSGGQARVVSGWQAKPGQIPYHLFMRMVNDEGFVTSCGASLVHHQWAISAAHCTAQRTALVVRAGIVDLTRPAMILEATEMISHHDYKVNRPSEVQPHDISLIRFQKPLEYNNIIQPIRIQRHEDRNRDYDNVRLMTSGFGLAMIGPISETLRWAYITGMTNEDCSNAYGDSSVIQETTVCAGTEQDSLDNRCQADSGGPLTVVENDGKPTLVGVTSFISAVGCQSGMPAGFVRAGHYHAWFKQVTGISFDWDSESDESSTDDPSSSSSESESSESSSSSSESDSESISSESDSEDSDSSSDSDTDEDTSFQKAELLPNAKKDVLEFFSFYALD